MVLESFTPQTAERCILRLTRIHSKLTREKNIQVDRRYGGVWVDKGGDGLVVSQVVVNYFTKIKTSVVWCGGCKMTGTDQVHTGSLQFVGVNNTGRHFRVENLFNVELVISLGF